MSVSCCCGCPLKVSPIPEGNENAGKFNHYCINSMNPINAMCAASS